MCDHNDECRNRYKDTLKKKNSEFTAIDVEVTHYKESIAIKSGKIESRINKAFVDHQITSDEFAVLTRKVASTSYSIPYRIVSKSTRNTNSNSTVVDAPLVESGDDDLYPRTEVVMDFRNNKKTTYTPISEQELMNERVKVAGKYFVHTTNIKDNEGTHNPYGNGQTEFWNGQPNGHYLTTAQLDVLVTMTSNGSTQAQIDAYIEQCFLDNYIAPPTKVFTTPPEESSSVSEPNSSSQRDGIATTNFELILGDVLTHGYTQLAQNGGNSNNVRKTELKVSASTAWSGANKQLVLDFAVWMSDVAVTALAPIYPVGLDLNSVVGHINDTNPTVWAAERRRVVISSEGPGFSFEVERYFNDWPVSTLGNYYVNIVSKVITNTGALVCGGIVTSKSIGSSENNVRVTDVDIISQVTPLIVNTSNTSQDVNVVNVPNVVVLNDSNTPIPVTFPAATVINTVITDVDLNSGRQTDPLNVLGNVSTIGPNSTSVKYDHTAKEPNDKWARYNNLFDILLTLPDTMLNVEINPHLDPVDVNPVELEEQRNPRNRPKKKKPEDRATDDEKAIQEHTNMLDLTLENKETKLSKDLAAATWHMARKQSVNWSALDYDHKIVEMTNLYYKKVKISQKHNLSAYYLKTLCFNAGLYNILPVINQFQKFGDVLSCCLYLSLSILDDSECWPKYQQYQKFCRDNDVLTFTSLDSQYTPAVKAVPIDARPNTSAPLKKYNHLGKEPNDTIIDEAVLDAMTHDEVVTEHLGDELITEPILEEKVMLSEELDQAKYLNDIKAMYPERVEGINHYITDRDELLKHVERAVARDMDRDSLSREELESFIKSINREATVVDKGTTYLANLMGHTNFLGPGYFGGDFKGFSDIETFLDKFTTKPVNEEDGIYRIHDLMASIHTKPGSLDVTNQKMIDYINDLKDPSLQAMLSKTAIQALGGLYGKYGMAQDKNYTKGLEAIKNTEPYRPTTQQYKTIVDQPYPGRIPDVPSVDPAFMAKIIASELVPKLEIVPESVPEVPITAFSESTIPGATRDEPVKELTDYQKYIQMLAQLEKRKFGPTNREMHAMNGNTVKMAEAGKALVTFLEAWAKTDDLQTLLGYKPAASTNALPNFDYYYYLKYLFHRSAPNFEKLIDKNNKVDLPIDGYTCFPAAWDVDVGSSFDPVAGIGPAIKTGEVAAPFEKLTEDEITTVISSLRTNTPIVHQSTNIGIWAITRDSSSEKDSTKTESETVGSAAMMLVKMWLIVDMMSANTEISPVWNKFDGKFVLPQNRTAPVGLNYFPYQVEDVRIHYWAITQQQAIAALYNDVIVYPAAYGNRAKGTFINITSEFRNRTNNAGLACIIASRVPSPLLDFPKSGREIDDAANNLVALTPTTFQNVIDGGKSNIQLINGVWVLNVVFVLTSWAATVQGNAYDYDYTIEFGNLVIDSRVNSMYANNGVFVDDTEPIAPFTKTLRQQFVNMSQGYSQNGIAMAQNYWTSTYGSKGDIKRAFILYSMIKTKFCSPAMVNVSCGTNNGKNVEGGISNRPVGPLANLVTNIPNVVDILEDVFRARDMFGVYCVDIEEDLGYEYSNMAYKYQLALATRVRKPVAGFIRSDELRCTTPEQRFYYAYEFASVVAALTDLKFRDIGMSALMMRSLEQKDVIGSLDQVLLNDYLKQHLTLFGCGQFLTRRNVPWDDNLLLTQNIADAYAMPSMILTNSMKLGGSFFQDEVMKAERDQSAVITKDNQQTGRWDLTVLNVLAPLLNFSANEKCVTVDVEAFRKLWQPNIVMIGILPYPEYNLPATRRLYSANNSTRLGFNLYAPFIMPSGRAYYNAISENLVGAFIPKNNIRLSYVDRCSMPETTPDTNKPGISLIMSNTMAQILLSNAHRIYQSNQFDNVSSSINPAESYNVISPGYQRHLDAMKALQPGSVPTDTESLNQ